MHSCIHCIFMAKRVVLSKHSCVPQVTMSEEAIVVREASAADYEDIMALDEIYGGLDYLPHFYPEFIKDPNRILMVAQTKRGKVVGLLCNCCHLFIDIYSIL